MDIRMATHNDLALCAGLDGSYQSERVWQMEAPEQESEIRVVFRTTRLPRKLQVPYPLDPMVLEWDLQHEECFLVAEEEGEIVAFLDMRIQAWQRLGWVHHLVVDRNHRR
ncbi:MAG: GNAT family N-acetyltransferase, partial [Chloroflexi bacterium]|nr:GNAT family N-acetyltransferase [Chloroflexota bacterium]